MEGPKGQSNFTGEIKLGVKPGLSVYIECSFNQYLMLPYHFLSQETGDTAVFKMEASLSFWIFHCASPPRFIASFVLPQENHV